MACGWASELLLQYYHYSSCSSSSTGSGSVAKIAFARLSPIRLGASGWRISDCGRGCGCSRGRHQLAARKPILRAPQSQASERATATAHLAPLGFGSPQIGRAAEESSLAR